MQGGEEGRRGWLQPALLAGDGFWTSDSMSSCDWQG